MHREGKRVVIAGEDGCGAVALMHVAIDDRGATDQLSRTHRANRDSHVVEYAKSFAAIGEGVMSAAGEVRAVAFSEAALRCSECATDSVERTTHE